MYLGLLLPRNTSAKILNVCSVALATNLVNVNHDFNALRIMFRNALLRANAAAGHTHGRRSES